MSHEFTQKIRDLFFWNTICWWCEKPHASSLHHIMGRVSNSPLNAAPINNNFCHLGNGRLSQFEIRKIFLKKTYEYLIKQGYKFTKEDIEFKQKFKQYYETN